MASFFTVQINGGIRFKYERFFVVRDFSLVFFMKKRSFLTKKLSFLMKIRYHQLTISLL